MTALFKPPPIIPDTLAQYHPPAAGSPVRSTSGTPVRGEAAPITIWVAELTGYTAHTEGQQGGARRAQFTTRYLTRYRPDFDARGRLSVAGRDYELIGITPAPHTYRKTWLHLHCHAVK